MGGELGWLARGEPSFASPTLTHVTCHLPYMVISRLRAMCHCPKSARERATAHSRVPNPLTLPNLPNLLTYLTS